MIRELGERWERRLRGRCMICKKKLKL